LIGLAGGGVGGERCGARPARRDLATHPGTPASTASRGRLSFGYFSSKYGSTCSAQSVAQSTNDPWSRSSSLIPLPLSASSAPDGVPAGRLPLEISPLLRYRRLATGGSTPRTIQTA
jgi:hypothetical protein